MTDCFLDPEDFLNQKGLPSHEIISTLANMASEFLENEVSDYRSAASNGNPGSLIELQNDLPAIIVPDIHARPDFIKNILNYVLPYEFYQNEEELPVNLRVIDVLKRKLINLICVGDAIHTELTAERWNVVSMEFDEELHTGPAMKAEMKEGLAVVCALMALKLSFPENFHFIKGNHENIMNESTGGDFAFCKYADEGEMVKSFISEYYGDDVLYLLSCWEKALPLMVVGKNFLVSHAEPKTAYSREELVDARFYDKVVNGLIWTRNGEVLENTAQKMMEHLLSEREASTAFYFAGHRPVSDNYALRQNGRFVQIHNPRKQNIALVSNKKIFDPEKDIVGVDE